MATQRLPADQRRGMLLATQAAGAADPEDGQPLPALAAVQGLAGGAAAPRAAGPATSHGGEAVASGGAAAAAAAAAAASTGTRSRRSDLRDSKVQDWLRLVHRSRIGPRLLELRETQRRNNLPVEKYGLAHVYKLGTARQVWVQEPREWCKDIHRKRDRNGNIIRCTICTTCHWCRQKTPQVKTQCSACHANRDNVYGGPYAGVICGNCLWTRFGENLHEVRQDPNWLCPACRQICNCSANNCVRSKNGWVPTNQLISEAESLGYESVAHYLVLSQLDEDLLANITDNVHSLQPMLDDAQACRLNAVKRQRNERDETVALRTAAESLVDRELAAMRAATGLTDERVNAVAARNQQLLAALGFGQGTLAADLMDDDDEDDELLPSPGAVRAGSVAPAASVLGLGGSRGSPTAVSGALQQVLHPSPGAPELTQLTGSLGAGSASLGGSGLSRRRVPPRRPGEPPPWAAAGAAAAAAGAAAGAATPAAAAAGQWASPAAAALQAAHQLIAPAAAAPAAAAAAVAPSGSSGLLAAAGGGQSVAGAPADAAEGTDDSGAAAASAAAGGASAAEPGRQERLDGLLHRDANAAFPAGQPEGDGVLPGLALDLRPAPARGVSRQPGAAGLPPSGLPRPPLRPHLQQQQSRLTPVAALGSKQARAASVEPGAGGRLAAAGQQAVQPMDAEEAAGGGVGQRSASPMEVAEPSQQLGLSPGAAELQTAPQQQAGASPDAADAGAAVSPPAATPALGDAAGAGAAPAKKRDMSSPAADWHCLHHSARQLVEEVLQADPASPGYAAGEYVLTAEQAEARYTRVYERNMPRLQEILAKANGWLTEPLVVLRTDSFQPFLNALPFDALQEMVNLYNSLATMLPDDDVWQVVQRLVCQDCFVDCERSHWSARVVLMKAWIELQQTLIQRELRAPLRNVYRAISDIVASLAEDGSQLQCLLGKIRLALHGSYLEQLPDRDQRIGPYHYNATERARGLSQVYTQLQGMCNLVEQQLYESLQLCQAEAAHLQHDAMHLISPRLVDALLGNHRGMTHRTKQAGAELVFLALRFSCLQGERQSGLELSVVEINRRREERLRMCQIVKELVPLLEKVVAADYPLWRAAGAAMDAARQDGQEALSTGGASGPAFKQTMGQGGLNTLTHAYAYLMECGQMSWQELEQKAIQPYSSPAAFWQLSNRVYRGFGMSLIADTLQHVTNLSMPDPRTRTWLLRHWLLCLLDRSRRFNTGEKLTHVLSQLPETRALFAGLEPAQLAIGADSLGQQTSVVLCHVMRALARDFSWRPHLPELLLGLDELLERRDKEVAGSDPRSRTDRLRYGARLYRLLGAVLLAATPLMPLPPAVAPPGPALASTVDQLRRLAQRMAMLVVGSCLASQREFAEQQAARAAAAKKGLAALDAKDDQGSALSVLGDVRQRLQFLPCGQLSMLWQVLLAWGAPAACQASQQLLKPVVAVVGCALELCSGEVEASPFDQAVLERLADSLLSLPEHQQQDLRQANPGAASLAQLREFLLGTLLRRYLGRCHIPTEGGQRVAVNAVRLLEILLRSLRGEEEVQGALLPLLWSLLDALRPRIPATNPFNGSGTQEAIFSMLARLLQQGGPLARLLPPLAGPVPGTGRAAVVSKALHSFWSAVASHALECCGQEVWKNLAQDEQLLQTRQEVYRTKLRADKPPRLLPHDLDPAANVAVNTVSGLCGRLAQQWSVNVEELCVELSKQLELMRREAAVLSSGAAAAAQPQQPSAAFRPADFGWTLAHSALRLFAAFQHTHPGSGAEAGQPSPGSAGAEAGADSLPATAAGGPAASAAAAGGRPQQWQDLPPGQQWAFGCLFAPARLVLVAGVYSKPLQDAYKRFQTEVQAAVGPLMPRGVCLVNKAARQLGAAQPPQPGDTGQPQPEGSCMGGNSVMAGPSAAPQRQQPLQQQQQGRSMAVPAASGIAASAVAGRAAPQQQVQVKQEPLSQPAGPAAAAARQSQQPPSALGPRQEPQRLDRDVSFAELPHLPRRSLVQLVGYVRRRPAIKEGNKGGVLQLDLRDHKHRRVVLLVQQADEPQLFDQLQAEANRRFDSQPNQLHMLRASNAMLLESAAGGSAAGGSAVAAVSSSGRGSGGSSVGQHEVCLLKKSGRCVPSVGWDPTGERAANIRQACADGLIRVGEEQAVLPQTAATQATVLQPSVHRPETQVTPAMNWTLHLRAAAGGSPGATQVADAGGEAGTSTARPPGAFVPATQVAMSQAPSAAAQRTAGATSRTPWQQLALGVAALLQPHGFSRADAIQQVKRFQGEREAWLARGAPALAAEICRQAGKPPPAA